MPNNPINKVVFGEDTLIDLTGDTVTADKLAQGYTAHNAAGVQITGTMTPGGGGEESMYAYYQVAAVNGVKTVTGCYTSTNFQTPVTYTEIVQAIAGGQAFVAGIVDVSDLNDVHVYFTTELKIAGDYSTADIIFSEEVNGSIHSIRLTHNADDTFAFEEKTISPSGAAVFTYNLDTTDQNNITVISAPTFAEIMATAQTGQSVTVNIFVFLPGISPTNPVFALSTTNIMLLMMASPFSIDISAIGNVSSSSAGWVTISHNANDEITAKVITHNIPQA